MVKLLIQILKLPQKIFNRLFDVIYMGFRILTQQEDKRKGDESERFVEMFLFPKEHYDMLHRTVDTITYEDRKVESSRLPDFQFRDRATGKAFWVEVKYRGKWYGDEPEQYLGFIKDHQLKRYQEVDKELPVFIAICASGDSLEPNESFLIPVRYIKMADRIYKKYLLPFKSHDENDELYGKGSKPSFRISSKDLWKRLD